MTDLLVVEDQTVEAVLSDQTTELVLEVSAAEALFVEQQETELVVEDSPMALTVEQQDTALVVEDQHVQELVVELEGPPGARGDTGAAGSTGADGRTGPVGDAGPAGASAVLTGGAAVDYVQSVPSSLWVFIHPFPYRPDVETYDNGGYEMFGDVSHPALGVVHVSFGFEMTGTLRLL